MTNQPKTALILGITGGYGFSMARQLGSEGLRLKALVRNLKRGEAAAARLGSPIELVLGDVLDQQSLNDAMVEVDWVIHGVNAPYHKWDPLVLDAAQTVGRAASRVGATIAFPGNVYNYSVSDAIVEGSTMAPVSRKGRMRVRIEETLLEASRQGARLIVLRGGDFFGLDGSSTWMHEMLRAVDKGKITLPGPADLRHQWAYLPDFARAHSSLLQMAEELPRASFFHFEGHVATGHQLLQAVSEASGHTDLRAGKLPWAALRLAGPFVPMVREILEMRYLWDEEVIMDGRLLHKTIGQRFHTPFVDALRQELGQKNRIDHDEGSRAARAV